MTLALYTSSGPLACIGTDRMLDALAEKAEPMSALADFCSDRAGLADAGLADAAAATGTQAGILLAAALRSAGVVLPAICWLDEWRAEPQTPPAVVHVDVAPPNVTVEAAKNNLAPLAEAMVAAFAGLAATLAESIGKIKIENHVTLPPMSPTFKGGDVTLPELKPIIVGGSQPIVMEGVELADG